MAEQVLQEINKQRRSNGLSDLKMDANFTEAAMDIALQVQEEMHQQAILIFTIINT